MFANAFGWPLLQTSFMTTLMIFITSTGILDKVVTEDGLEHYAEQCPDWFPLCSVLPMPFNTAINLIYSLVGIIWMLKIKRCVSGGYMRSDDAYMFYVFCWLPIIYGPIQLARIITQHHHWGIMDQWYTLPMFAWIAYWGQNFEQPLQSNVLPWGCMGLSVCSYMLALGVHIGFEIALGVHIVLAVYAGCMITREPWHKIRHKSEMISSFVKACICCALFVILKVLDPELPKVHDLFTIISGHFLSKIADVGQIHYVLLMFYSIVKDRSVHVKDS